MRSVAVLLSLLCLTTALVPPCSRPAVQPTRRAALAGVLGLAVPSMPALALVTGSKPPEGGFKAKKAKCKNIDVCEAAGEKAADQKFGTEEVAFERTDGGDRFRDLTPGTGKKAAKGDAVEIRYRVMRLGTRARDGLSGEGQTSATPRTRTHHQPTTSAPASDVCPFCLLPPAVFSYGFGEDEDKEGDKMSVQLDGKNLVAGADAAIIGMQPGGRRRVLVRPERGWRLLTGACAEGEKTLDLTAAKRTSATDGGNLVFKAPIVITLHHSPFTHSPLTTQPSPSPTPPPLTSASKAATVLAQTLLLAPCCLP